MTDGVNGTGGLDAEYAAYARAYEEGGYRAAAPHAQRILATVDRWWLRANGQAQVLAAQMRYTLARAAQDAGDAAAAADHVERGLRAADRARRAGDPRIAFERVMLLLTRAEARMSAGRAADALADLDEAAAIDDASGHPSWQEGQIHLLLARQWALQQQGRFDASERAAREALERASQHEPRLVPTALDRLSMIRRLTGSADEGAQHLRTASAIQAAQGTRAVDRAEHARHRASLALETGDLAEAEAALAEAEDLFRAAGDARSAAGAVVGFAEVARQRGDLDAAIAAARRAAEEAAHVGETTSRIEAHTVLASALDDAGRSDEALAAHDEARRLAAEAGDRIELVRIDVRRAVVLFNVAVRAAQRAQQRSAFGQAAGATTGDPEALAAAADVAVPAALAADAVRAGMDPGPVRESWMREVSLRVADAALQTLTALGRTDEIVDLLEHVAASATLDPADGPAGGDGLAPPPCVRSFPGREAPIAWAIAAAEERYGFRARADEEVTAW